jgi:hypothetical protein
MASRSKGGQERRRERKAGWRERKGREKEL